MNVLTATITLIACSACSEDDAMIAPRESPETVARGRALFAQHCAICHGERADGRGVRREGLSSRPADLTRPEWKRDQELSDVVATIRDGKPRTSMPAWRGLGEPAVADLAVYVWSLSERRER